MTGETVPPRDAIVMRAMRMSVSASFFVALLKLCAAFFAVSLALTAEAIHAFVDIGVTILTATLARFALQPADDDHHYGHGKLEILSALIETLLLLTFAFAITWEAIHALITPREAPQVSWPAFALLGVVALIDLSRWAYLKKMAEKTESLALRASAAHFSVDFIQIVVVVFGALCVSAGYPKADALTALSVAAFAFWTGASLTRSALSVVVDAAPQGVAERVRQILEEIDEVVSVRAVRARFASSVFFIDITLKIPRVLSQESAKDVKEACVAAIKAVYPGADVSLVIDPVIMDNEAVFEKVLMVAARKRVPVHHIVVHTVDTRWRISLDMEVEGDMLLRDAHEIATDLEHALSVEFGDAVAEIDVHLDPLEPSDLIGEEVSDEDREDVERLVAISAEYRDLKDNVTLLSVSQTEKGLIIALSVASPAEKSVIEAHAVVDALERAIKEKDPGVFRIVTRARPVALKRN